MTRTSQWEFGLYECALLDLEKKLKGFNQKAEQSMIQSIKHRIKSEISIIKKLMKKGLPLTIESISKHIHDIAGMRIICSFVDDVYSIKQYLESQEEINVLKVKDYIKHPKQNGYRSLHMIIEVPVCFSDYVQMIKIEVQIRTIAMDFWSSLEHQLVYKSVFKDNAHVIEEELKAYADWVCHVDDRMVELKQELKEKTT